MGHTKHRYNKPCENNRRVSTLVEKPQVPKTNIRKDKRVIVSRL
jgi:hypothetical protein